jgi:peroxiredoxin
MNFPAAPEWCISEWLNTPKPLSLARLRGQVIVLHAFQMLCPACVSHALPQARRLTIATRGTAVAVIGLHTVFEHHYAMTVTALRAFLHEYRIHFPIGVDARNERGGDLPRTMRAYAMEGTPTTVLIDADGGLRRQWFGVVDELTLGIEIGRLLASTSPATVTINTPSGCSPPGGNT